MTKLMVEIFKTNVTDPSLAESVLQALSAQFQGCRPNFDLDDCDHILRVELPGEPVPAHVVIGVLLGFGFIAEVLDDLVPLLVPHSSSPGQLHAPRADSQQTSCSSMNQPVL